MTFLKGVIVILIRSNFELSTVQPDFPLLIKTYEKLGTYGILQLKLHEFEDLKARI